MTADKITLLAERAEIDRLRAANDRLEREVLDLAEELAWLKSAAGPLLLMARLVPKVADHANAEAAALGVNEPFPPESAAWLMVPASLRNWPTVDDLRRIAGHAGYAGKEGDRERR